MQYAARSAWARLLGTTAQEDVDAGDARRARAVDFGEISYPVSPLGIYGRHEMGLVHLDISIGYLWYELRFVHKSPPGAYVRSLKHGTKLALIKQG